MKIHRMTLDVYTLLSQLKVAMREVAFVVGAEGVGNCGPDCSFCTADSPDEHCFQRCYVPNAIFTEIARINDHGCGFREVPK